jgi:hypothetical protein
MDHEGHRWSPDEHSRKHEPGDSSMATAKKAGEFSFKSTGTTYVDAAGGGVVHINLDGTATGFGTVLGTLSLESDGPGIETGRTSWSGEGYLDNGEVMQSTGEGFYERTGKHVWRVRSILRVSNGAIFTTDALISLKGRTYKGTMTPFD